MLSVSPAFADVRIDIRTRDTGATTRPSAGEPAVSVVAVPDHNFAAKLSTAGRTVNVTGIVHELPEAHFRIHVAYDDQIAAHGSDREVETTVELKAGETTEIAGFVNGQVVELTLRPS